MVSGKRDKALVTTPLLSEREPHQSQKDPSKKLARPEILKELPSKADKQNPRRGRGYYE